MHTQLTFENLDDTQKEIIIAKLYDYCEGFEEFEGGLKAIINTEKFTGDLKEILQTLQLKPIIEEILPQNWNLVWESNFEPVLVEDFVYVRADFHKPVTKAKHEIIITPKMSFGTGHHATTYLMMQMMREIDFAGKSVFDFGTGTGILSILAKKLGATNIIATDIDSWSIENAAENFQRNEIDGIELLQSESALHGNNNDIILANINKNILMGTIPQLASLLKANGILLLSGLLETDENDIVKLCTKSSLKLMQKSVKNGWIALKFNKL